MRQITIWTISFGIQDLVMFGLGGLFAGRLYGYAKRLYGHVEGVVGQLSGTGAAKK